MYVYAYVCIMYTIHKKQIKRQQNGVIDRKIEFRILVLIGNLKIDIYVQYLQIDIKYSASIQIRARAKVQ